MISSRSREPDSGWTFLIRFSSLIAIGVAVVCTFCLLITGCATRQPAKISFAQTDADASSLADAVYEMQTLFGSLKPHVDGFGKALLTYASEYAGKTHDRAVQHVDELQHLQKRVQEMEAWGIEQQRLKDQAMQTWGYWTEFQIRYWVRRLMWLLVGLTIAGVVGQFLIGGLAGGLLSWPLRFFGGLLAHGTGLRTPLRLPAKAGK